MGNELNKDNYIFSLDIGTRSIKAAVGKVEDGKFIVKSEKFKEHEERAMIDGQIHDIKLVSETVNEIKTSLEDELHITLSYASIAAAGRFLKTIEAEYDLDISDDVEIDKKLVRSLEMSALKEAENEIKKSSDGKLYCVGYSVKNYYLNSYVISNLIGHRGANIKVSIIATFLPRSVIDSLYSVMDKCGLQVSSLTLEPIAAMEAVIPQKLRLLNISLVDIGAGTSDIAICSNDTVSAYGMVPFAGDEITECIAQRCLVDFNTAEIIKKEIEIKDEIEFIDIIGIQNTIKSSELKKTIEPVVIKMAEQICTKIIELNGDKSPSAVFLVGGGAHTPLLKDYIAEKLGISSQRIAIKGREAVVDCVCNDNDMGSMGVTVLGIAITAVKNYGRDFMEVILNDSVISLFNTKKHTIMDALIHAEINPKILIGKNGRNIKFTLNGKDRVAFGELSKKSEIYLNGNIADLESIIQNGDIINIKFATNGRDASPKLIDYVNSSLYSEKNVIIDGKIFSLGPLVIVNDVVKDFDYIIKTGDNIEIKDTVTLRDMKKYMNKDNDEIFLNDKIVDDSYEISEGDIFTTRKKENNLSSSDYNVNQKENDIKKEIKVIINDEECTLSGKSKYVFVDIFDFYPFDLTIARGSIKLILNNRNAQYNDVLSTGDVIRVYWE